MGQAQQHPHHQYRHFKHRMRVQSKVNNQVLRTIPLQTMPPSIYPTKTCRSSRLQNIAKAILSYILPLLMLTGFGWLAFTNYSASHQVTAVHTRRVVVLPGMSLWSLAEKYDYQDNPWSVERWIEKQNGLKSADIQVGETLIVPEH